MARNERIPFTVKRIEGERNDSSRMHIAFMTNATVTCTSTPYTRYVGCLGEKNEIHFVRCEQFMRNFVPSRRPLMKGHNRVEENF